jgi:hypothetical protein
MGSNETSIERVPWEIRIENTNYVYTDVMFGSNELSKKEAENV